MRKLLILLLVLMLVGCQSSEIITEIEVFNDDQVIEIEDETLLINEQKVSKEAVSGEKQLTYEVTYDFRRQEIDRKLLEEKVLKEPTPKEIRVGVREEKIKTKLVSGFDIEVITQLDDTLAQGQEVVVQEGNVEEAKITTKEVYIRNKLVSSEEISKEILVDAKPRIVKIGTKEEKPVVVNPDPTPTQPTLDYNQIDNTDYGWWFSWGNPKASISADVSNLIAPYNVYWQIPTDEKVVYLTFDQGYEYNNNTSSILDTLKAKNVKATFFITGSYYDQNPELVNRMFDEGHVVGNHTIHHFRAPTILASDQNAYISDVVDLNAKVPGLSMYHRPPEGGYSQRSLAILNDLGYKTVFWSFAYKDWLTDDQPNPSEALNLILGNIHPGSIILLHSVSNTNTQILSDVIDGIHNQGYSIKLLP